MFASADELALDAEPMATTSLQADPTSIHITTRKYVESTRSDTRLHSSSTNERIWSSPVTGYMSAPSSRSVSPDIDSTYITSTQAEISRHTQEISQPGPWTTLHHKSHHRHGVPPHHDEMKASSKRALHCLVSGCRYQGTFARQYDLSRHINTMHPEQGGSSFYVCTITGCAHQGKHWPRLDKFREHVRKAHSGFQLEEYIDA